MPAIRQLPTSVINKIAAGEVIERPASVVKELLENSLDAGATRVDVTVEKGGAELIRITDNGRGIAAEELPLAVASHATSKIADAEDLFRVATLGFRGEALASIAEISRLVIRSRPPQCEAGAELEVVGGRAEPIRPVGAPEGTTIEVRKLFFNTPVRQKFLRTTQTEMGHTAEAVTRLALANPGVHFTITHGGRLVHDLPPVEDCRQRVATLFGSEIAESLIEIKSEDEQMRLDGYVANPNHSRANNRMQYLFLNGRHIRDRSLQHALGEAYRGLLLTGRYPICFLHLQLSPASVDVNVHPTKLEVRFQDGGRVYSHLLGTLRSKFLTTDLVARGSLSHQPSEESNSDSGESLPSQSHLFDWAKRQLSADAGDGFPEFRPAEDLLQGRNQEMLQLHRVDRPPHPQARAALSEVVESSQDTFEATQPQAATFGSHRSRAIQIHNRYLVVENDDGMEVIDQHALHERILYELLRDKVTAGALESQKLLVPEPIDLSADEASALLTHKQLLHKLGLEIEEFGGETVLVSAYPAMLANFSPAEVIQSLAEQLGAEGKQPAARDLLDDLLHLIACKAAVKYGDRLSSEEVDSLLAQRHLVDDHHHCPHGRPTALVFTREQLDRQFKRI